MKFQTICSILFMLLVAVVCIYAEPDRKEICQTCHDVYELSKKFSDHHFSFSNQQIQQEVYSFCAILPNTADQCRVMSTQVPTFVSYIKSGVPAEKCCLDLGWCHE